MLLLAGITQHPKYTVVSARWEVESGIGGSAAENIQIYSATLLARCHEKHISYEGLVTCSERNFVHDLRYAETLPGT
jgi:hypothetical protein